MVKSAIKNCAVGAEHPVSLTKEGPCQLSLSGNSGVVPIQLNIEVPEAPRDAYPLNGLVILQPEGHAKWAESRPRATLPLAGIALERPPETDWSLIVRSSWAAFGAVATAGVICWVLWGWTLPFRRMGTATFSFTDSWSNALMLGTPLLTAFLTTFTAFPEYPQTMSKKSYLLLSLLLSAVIGLAPAIFNLWRLPTPVTAPDGTQTTQNQGLVLFFLFSAFVALTGGLGQLRLLRLVLGDLQNAGLVSARLGGGLVWASEALFWIVLAASIISMVTTVSAVAAHPRDSDAVPAAPPAGGLRSFGRKLAEPVTRLQTAPAKPLPPWSMP